MMHVSTRVKSCMSHTCQVMHISTRDLQVTMASSGTALKRMCMSPWRSKAFSPANLSRLFLAALSWSPLSPLPLVCEYMCMSVYVCVCLCMTVYVGVCL